MAAGARGSCAGEFSAICARAVEGESAAQGDRASLPYREGGRRVAGLFAASAERARHPDAGHDRGAAPPGSSLGVPSRATCGSGRGLIGDETSPE